MESIKMVLVVRKDLNMRKGKIAAQCSHAAVNAVLNNIETDDFNTWLNNAATKICVGVNSEEELCAIAETAKEKGLPIALVEDAGRTEFHGVPTLTCLAIGPAKGELIDQVTGHLTLL